MVPWNSSKAKVQLRLGVQRLRTLQEKKGAQAKAARRDIALLLEKGKVETARIKVENIIHEDIYVELLELLELYCELLLARFGLLDQNSREPDPGISEGVCSIIYAAPRTELKELHVLREILMHKYGREFSVAVMENRDNCVSDRVTRKINVPTPSSDLVDAYLSEISKGYGVAWSPPTANKPDDDHGADGGVKEATDEKAQPVEVPVPMKADEISAEARTAGVRTPKLPDIPPTEGEEAPKQKTSKGPVQEPPKEVVPPEEDEFEALARRFQALKSKR